MLYKAGLVGAISFANQNKISVLHGIYLLVMQYSFFMYIIIYFFLYMLNRFVRMFSFSTHNSHAQSQSSAATFSVPTHSAIPKFKNGQLMEMKHIFRKHVKPKKQHEIQNLSKVTSEY